MPCRLLGLLLTARRLHDLTGTQLDVLQIGCPHDYPTLPWLVGEVFATEVFLPTRHQHGCSALPWPLSVLLAAWHILAHQRPLGYMSLSYLLANPTDQHLHDQSALSNAD